MMLKRYKKKNAWAYTLQTEINGVKTEDAHHKYLKLPSVKETIQKKETN